MLEQELADRVSQVEHLQEALPVHYEQTNVRGIYSSVAHVPIFSLVASS